ncbi:NED1 [Sanghuangporus weigelae]
MNYLRGALNAASQYYRDINPSTLTGAIDVIVVRRTVSGVDGAEGSTEEELACSPFHVRFGKWQVLRPVDKKVKVMVNGREIPFNMKIGDAGEAFFVFETDSDVPEDLITSPLLEATRPDQSSAHVGAGRFGAKIEEGEDRRESRTLDSENEPEPLDLDSPDTSGTIITEPPETGNTSNGSPPSYSWEWGAFPTPSPMKATFPPTGIDSLETQRSLSVPPELGHELDFPRPSSPPRSKTNDASRLLSNSPVGDVPGFFGKGAELNADERSGRRFLLSVCGKTYEFELSISEELAACEGGGSGDEIRDARRFRDGQVSFRRFIKYPGVVQDKNMVIRWKDKYITRNDTSVLFDCLTKWREAALAKPVNAKALEEEEPLSSSDETEPEELTAPKKSSSSWVRWWRSSRSEAPGQPQPRPTSAKPLAQPSSDIQERQRRPSLIQSSSAPPKSDGRNTPVSFPTMSESKLNGDASTRTSRSASEERVMRFAKTLRLTSDQLKQLDLKPGKNLITFSLSASGVTACTASIFLWEETDSIVVSDIDGTITKSDALGHVFTMIGRDWTHLGVAKLYTDIARNGYRILYLTSRAIGQADSTRYYLKSINQNNYQLPEGPVIMSPDRLMTSLHREVIMRKPEMFKMACLRDIQRLFGEGKNPFYAGFGNRITDALSYRSVNIPSQRIFTIDSTGEVKMELLEVAGYKSSYIHLTDLVDQMFPPVNQKTETEYSDVNYWKTPIQEFALPDLTTPPASPALSAHSDASMSTFTRLRNFSLRQSTSSFFQASGTPTEQDERMTSLERLSKRHTRSTETLVEHAWSDDERGRGFARSRTETDETSRERRARKRLSLDSMPGSLDGSLADLETDEEDEIQENYGDEDEDRHGEYEEEGHYDGEPEDPEEAAEEGFDDDLLATGEMESVPFL